MFVPDGVPLDLLHPDPHDEIDLKSPDVPALTTMEVYQRPITNLHTTITANQRPSHNHHVQSQASTQPVTIWVAAIFVVCAFGVQNGQICAILCNGATMGFHFMQIRCLSIFVTCAWVQGYKN